MEIGINEYEKLKTRINDLEVENKLIKEENNFYVNTLKKFYAPFKRINIPPEVFDDIFQNFENVELVNVQQPWDYPLTATIGLKIRYRRRL